MTTHEYHDRCVLCGLPGFKPIAKHGTAHLVKCPHCGMVFSGRIPSKDTLKAHYWKYRTSDEMPELIRKRYNELLDKFEPFRRTNYLLDYGCGDGFLLDLARQRGWNVYGTEFDQRYIDNCNRRGIPTLPVPVTPADFPEKFDVIACIEVLEHLSRPAEEMALFHNVMRPGGLLYLTTPNFNTLSLDLVGSDWSVIRYPEHLCYFTRDTLCNLGRRHYFSARSLESNGISFGRISLAVRTKLGRLFHVRNMNTDVDINEDQRISAFVERFPVLRWLKKKFNEALSRWEKGDTLKVHFINEDETAFPRISIITPSYQQGVFIEATILSVLTQHYPNLEYILIDGASTDDTLDKVRIYADRMSYWVSERDRGQSEAINKGLRRATGEIVSWLCSDDILLPGALFRVAGRFAEHPGAGLIHGRTVLFNNDKSGGVIKGAESEDLHLRYLAYIPFPQPSSFFRREILLEHGYLDEKLHFGMDYDLLIKIALNYTIFPVGDILSKYRLHSGSKSMSQLAGFARDWVTVFSKCARTLELPSHRLEQLRTLGLYTEGDDLYVTSRQLTEAEKNRVLVYFLEYQLHIYYELLEIPLCERIASMIRDVDPILYRKRSINDIHFKSKYVPAHFIRFFRKIKRRL